MSRAINISLIFCFLASLSWSQQVFNYSHNLTTPGMQNPAFARYNDEVNFSLMRKSVYGKINGSPIENNFYVSTPINANSGIGMFVNQGTQGIFKQINANIQYGRAFNLTEYIRLGLGVSAGVQNQSINLEEIIVFDPDDPFLLQGVNKSTTYDASFGMYLNSSKFLFRLSAPHLLGNRYGNNFEKFRQQIITNVQYKFPIKRNFIVMPTAGLNYTLNAPLGYNVGMLLYYKSFLWAGVQYKKEYAISPMLGLSYKKFNISYSYDYSNIAYNNLGIGHEILLEIKIHKGTNKAGNISSEEAEGRVIELIDEYFDVQNSDIDLFERLILMKKIENKIEELLPFLDNEKKKSMKKKLKSKTPKSTSPKKENN